MADVGICLQFRHRSFGEPAANKQTVDVGQMRVIDGVEKHQLGPRSFKSFEIVGVVKPEGCVPRDAYPKTFGEFINGRRLRELQIRCR